MALLTFLSAAAAAAAGGPPLPRHLLVEVRDTPPHSAAAIRHGADGSYSVSTGSGGSDDTVGPADNSTTLSTGNSVRRVHIMEGERVRVDLPSVQSLQFHMPVPGASAGAAKPATGATGTGAMGRSPARVNATGMAAGTGSTAAAGASGAAGTSAAAGTATTAASTPSVSGVVTFEAVGAFAARFALAGPTVRVELTPLPSGTISAPYAVAGAGSAPSTVIVQGRVGQWIALGDTELSSPSRNLNVTADPVRPASVWVRVQPDPAAPPD